MAHNGSGLALLGYLKNFRRQLKTKNDLKVKDKTKSQIEILQPELMLTENYS